MALSNEQLLLLNNLMYLQEPCQKVDNFEGKTVAEFIEAASQMGEDTTCGSFMTNKDWRDIFQAIRQDDDLMNMTIATTHRDYGESGGGGRSAVFISETTGDAAVVFIRNGRRRMG